MTDKRVTFENDFGLELEYLEVMELPSNFRTYDIDKVYVRGLNLRESEALSKYVAKNEDDYYELAKIYKSVIRGVDVYDLEMVDFLALVALSSTLTVDNFSAGRLPKVRCVNTVPNPRIKEIKEEINKKEEDLKKLTEKEEIDSLMEEIVNLEIELRAIPEMARCEGILESPITIYDFDFTEPELLEVKVLSVGKMTATVTPQFVKDRIEVDKYTNGKQLSETEEKIVYLASMLKIQDFDLEKKIRFLEEAPVSFYEELIRLEKKYSTEIKPIIKPCPKCFYKNRVFISLDRIKVYP